MDHQVQGGVREGLLEALRATPALAGVSEDALAKIAAVVASEMRERESAALRDVELFQGLSDADLEEIRRIAEPVRVEAGEVLFEEGAPGDRFYVIVSGSVELRKADRRLAVLKSGQGFGEMALLNEAPRSASAVVGEASHLVAISRTALGELLGGDTLAVRLLKGLSKALWATSVRLTAEEARSESPREALVEYNRMVRARLLPKGSPRLAAYDVSGATVAHDHGDGAAAWDWFELSDGRIVVAVMKADQVSLAAAQRLATTRALLRDFAADPVRDVASLLTRVNRALSAAWVEGLSGTVSCALLAIGSDDRVELAGAGAVVGTLVRAAGGSDDLVSGAPALGAVAKQSYDAAVIHLAPGDQVILFADGPSDSVDIARRVLGEQSFTGSKEALASVMGRIKAADAGVEGIFDLTAALVVRVPTVPARPETTAEAIARAAAAFESADRESAS